MARGTNHTHFKLQTLCSYAVDAFFLISPEVTATVISRVPERGVVLDKCISHA